MTTSVKQNLPARPAPANPLTRSYTEPALRPIRNAEPSMLVEALDLTGHKRSKSSLALTTLPAPSVVAPSAPSPDQTMMDRTVKVRSIINNLAARERALDARAQPGLERDPRMLHMPLLQVFIDDRTHTRYLISPPVRGGSHGEFHVVRRERPGHPSDLWAAKQVRIDDPLAPAPLKGSIGPRDSTDIARELCAMLSAGSPIVPTLLLRSEDRLFAMGPLCDGDLDDIKPRLQNMPPNVAELVLKDIVLQVARRMTAVHRGKYTHRDVKPGNILYKRNGQVYLADFSCAAINVPGQNVGLFGTRGFLAPEHVAYGSIDPKIDVFSLGCTLLDLMCYTPFEYEAMDSEDALLEELMTGERPGPKLADPAAALTRFTHWEAAFRAWCEAPDGEFQSDYPDLDKLFGYVQARFPSLFDLLLDMLAVDPKNRLSAEEVVEVLEALPRGPEDKALLAKTWAGIPRAPELDTIYRRWCEPHLPTLRRTTSVDNLPRFDRSVSADNVLLSTSSHEI